MKISATIITFNEEQNIKKCLDSLLEVADEIIVVDSYSTDRTAAICKQHSIVKFIENKFEGHVEQKNFAMENASYSYIISLDADERITNNLKNEILQIKEEGTPKDAYIFPRLNNYYGKWIKHGGIYPEKKIRFWNKEKGKWGGKNPHDKVVMQNSTSARQLKGDLLHYTTATIHSHLEQVNKFSEIAAIQLLQSKKKPNAIFKLLFDPPFMFFKKYVFQLGFLDGFDGFVIAIISAHAKFLKYAKYIQMKNQRK